MVLPVLARDDGADRAARQLADEGLVAAHGAVEDALAPRVGEELAAVAEQAAARHDEAERHAPRAGLHRLEPARGRAESFSITEPADVSGTSATTSSTGSQRTPSTSRRMISGRETLNS